MKIKEGIGRGEEEIDRKREVRGELRDVGEKGRERQR